MTVKRTRPRRQPLRLTPPPAPPSLQAILERPALLLWPQHEPPAELLADADLERLAKVLAPTLEPPLEDLRAWAGVLGAIMLTAKRAPLRRRAALADAPKHLEAIREAAKVIRENVSDLSAAQKAVLLDLALSARDARKGPTTLLHALCLVEALEDASILAFRFEEALAAAAPADVETPRPLNLPIDLAVFHLAHVYLTAIPAADLSKMTKPKSYLATGEGERGSEKRLSAHPFLKMAAEFLRLAHQDKSISEGDVFGALERVRPHLRIKSSPEDSSR